MAKKNIKAICPTCGKKAGSFKDTLSLMEFHISGMCQECQDSVFDMEEEQFGIDQGLIEGDGLSY